MKLEKAIEILTDLDTDLPQFRPALRREAVKLGIEALKTVQEMRHYPFPDGILKLPGED